MTLEEVLKYANENKITINKTFSNDDTILKNYVISQSVLPNTKLTEGQVVDIVVSIGPDYAKYKVDELGFVPIMMYHGIHDKKIVKQNILVGISIMQVIKEQQKHLEMI